jgi:hypothetical protein
MPRRLEGAQLPPVVIFEDTDGWKYLADDHHRVDAAVLAALKDPRRKAEVLAEIRPNRHDAGLCRKFPRWPRSGCAPGIALCR